MIKFLADNWEAFLTPITGIVTYFFTKRKFQKRELAKQDAGVTGANLANVSANFEVYQNLINDLEARFKKRVEELEIDLEKMKTLNEELRSAVARQEKYINKLLTKLEKYEHNPE